jgi:predicted  nucleic acid-binding Zn-ribbon protein
MYNANNAKIQQIETKERSLERDLDRQMKECENTRKKLLDLRLTKVDLLMGTEAGDAFLQNVHA